MGEVRQGEEQRGGWMAAAAWMVDGAQEAAAVGSQVEARWEVVGQGEEGAREVLAAVVVPAGMEGIRAQGPPPPAQSSSLCRTAAALLTDHP